MNLRTHQLLVGSLPGIFAGLAFAQGVVTAPFVTWARMSDCRAGICEIESIAEKLPLSSMVGSYSR